MSLAVGLRMLCADLIQCEFSSGVRLGPSLEHGREVANWSNLRRAGIDDREHALKDLGGVGLAAVWEENPRRVGGKLQRCPLEALLRDVVDAIVFAQPVAVPACHQKIEAGARRWHMWTSTPHMPMSVTYVGALSQAKADWANA